ncbi:MAG: hypothetical protein Q8P48_04725 [Deltaproteobacteria bacterium]|nr:hypothetical protein [Deltaproteobacteria bacterium]
MEALSLSYALPEEGEKEAGPALVPDERAVWKALDADLLHIDGIAERAGLPVVKVSSLLLGMELKGLVEQKPGKRFLRKF